jgi:hypothetical protein
MRKDIDQIDWITPAESCWLCNWLDARVTRAGILYRGFERRKEVKTGFDFTELKISTI